MNSHVVESWEKVKELFAKEFENIPEITKAWIRVKYCKHCGSMDDTGELDIVFDIYSLDMKIKMNDIERLIALQVFPLRFKSEHYGTERYLIIKDGSILFYFPDKDKEYAQLENIVCECSEEDLMWDEDGTYISQTMLDPDYYTILGKVDSDKAEIKRYIQCHKETLESYGWGFEEVDGKIHHHDEKSDVVECRFRTWKEVKTSDTETEPPKLQRTITLGGIHE